MTKGVGSLNTSCRMGSPAALRGALPVLGAPEHSWWTGRAAWLGQRVEDGLRCVGPERGLGGPPAPGKRVQPSAEMGRAPPSLSSPAGICQGQDIPERRRPRGEGPSCPPGAFDGERGCLRGSKAAVMSLWRQRHCRLSGLQVPSRSNS